MKTIARNVLLIAVILMAMMGCQKQEDELNVSLKSSVVPVKWITDKGGNVDCSQLGVDYYYSSDRVNWIEADGLYYFD